MTSETYEIPRMGELPADLQRLMERAIHSRLGVIRNLTESEPNESVPGLYTAWTRLADPYYPRTGKQSAPSERLSAAGAGLNRVECLYSTIGESIERYAGGIYNPATLIQSSAIDLGSSAFDCEKFVLFSSEQYVDGFPYAPYDELASRAWCNATLLSGDRTTLVPAQLVYLGYKAADRAEILTQSTSTGMACGAEIVDVAWTGLREVIERDAFACMWALRRSPPQIAIGPETIGLFSPGVSSILKRPELSITVFDITTDLGVPVVFVTIRPRWGSISTVVGASAHPDPLEAASKAIVEAYHSLSWALQAKMANVTAPPAIEDISNFHHHMEFYLCKDNEPRLEFLYNSPRQSLLLSDPFQVGDKSDQLFSMVNTLSARGYETLFVDLTTEDVRDLSLYTGRVLVPGLQPLHAGIVNYTNDTKRLAVVAEFLGVELPGTVNMDPHPFP
ncbi:MAG: ribosomal protein S12 methylthiotransferase accessory factor [Brevundimonas sp.]|uniref:YcaO-like family protein n=1 Tax=Brevundimonas sp. TaxID=1871086 RepID=UPI0039E5D9DC